MLFFTVAGIIAGSIIGIIVYWWNPKPPQPLTDILFVIIAVPALAFGIPFLEKISVLSLIDTTFPMSSLPALIAVIPVVGIPRLLNYLGKP